MCSIKVPPIQDLFHLRKIRSSIIIYILLPSLLGLFNPAQAEQFQNSQPTSTNPMIKFRMADKDKEISKASSGGFSDGMLLSFLGSTSGAVIKSIIGRQTPYPWVLALIPPVTMAWSYQIRAEQDIENYGIYYKTADNPEDKQNQIERDQTPSTNSTIKTKDFDPMRFDNLLALIGAASYVVLALGF